MRTTILAQTPAPGSTLLLSSRDGSHTGLSGYSTLARYIPSSTFLEVQRRSPSNLFTRLLTAVNRRFTLVNWAWGSSLHLEWKALRLLRENPDRLVHYLWADRDMAYLDLLKKRLGFRMVGTFHNCPDQAEGLYNFPRRLKAIDHFIIVSSCQADGLIRGGVPADKISVVLHGVDSSHFSPRERHARDKFRVLSVGSWRRDFACMEEVFRRLSAQPGIEMVCLVEARWRQKWSGIPNLRLPERVSDSELLELYRSSDVMLMCAEASTANNALVEGLACGLPIVGTDVGGVREYCTESAGMFFNAGDATGAVDAVLKLRGSEEFLWKLSQGARRRGVELDWHKIAAQITGIHDAVSGAKGN
jgi:glycosyltransferase involved in cell wall biosynthesis